MSERLSAETLEELGQDHVRKRCGCPCKVEMDVCDWCDFGWPCPTVQLLAEVAALRAERDAARELAERLGEQVALLRPLLEIAQSAKGEYEDEQARICYFCDEVIYDWWTTEGQRPMVHKENCAYVAALALEVQP